MHVAVLTCDVVGSREFRRVPTQIALTLRKLNKRYKPALVAAFAVTLGDEFQGVLREINKSYRLYLEAQNTLEFPIYAGLGIGMAEASEDHYAPHMTGEAFTRSREALAAAKKKHRTFVARTGIENVDATVNALALAAQFIRSHHTNRQSSLANMLLFDPQLTSTELAKKLSISKSAVSQILKAAGFEALREIDHAIMVQFTVGKQ